MNEFLASCLRQYEQQQQQQGNGGQQPEPSPNADPRTNILRCLMSWITLGAFPLATIETNPIVHFAFR